MMDGFQERKPGPSAERVEDAGGFFFASRPVPIATRNPPGRSASLSFTTSTAYMASTLDDEDPELDFHMESVDFGSRERPSNPMAQLFISQSDYALQIGLRSAEPSPAFRDSALRHASKRVCTDATGEPYTVHRVLFPSPEAAATAGYPSRRAADDEQRRYQQHQQPVPFQPASPHSPTYHQPTYRPRENSNEGVNSDAGIGSIECADAPWGGAATSSYAPSTPEYTYQLSSMVHDSPGGSTGPGGYTPPQKLYAKSPSATQHPALPWPRSPDQVFHTSYTNTPGAAAAEAYSPSSFNNNRLSPLREVLFFFVVGGAS